MTSPHPHGWHVPHPHWPHQLPTPPPRRNRRGLWLSIAAVVAVVVMVAAMVLVAGDEEPADRTATAASPTAPGPDQMPPTPVPVSALSSLLLTPEEAAAVVGSKSMAGNADYGDKIYEAMADNAVVDESCMSLSPGLERSYQGSGFTASRQQFLKGESADRKLVQTVVSFPDAAAAHKHFMVSKAKWKACANRTINLAAVGADPNHWRVGDVIVSDDMVTASRVEEGGAGWGCRDGLAARSNIVIDFAVCGEDVPESVLPAFVAKVSTKIADLHN